MFRVFRVFKLEPAPVVRRTRARICRNSLKQPMGKSDGSELTHSRGSFEGLPKGLIGAKCTALVYIEGKRCSCLLDTGSQVTTISQSYHEQNLPQLKIIPLENLLEIEAANGQAVPYVGYVEAKVVFPKEFLGSTVEVSTLALVIPDARGSIQPKVLIGTNTLDLAYEKHLEDNDSSCKSVPFGYKAVIRTIEYRRKQRVNSNIGVVRLPSASATVVPARHNLVLEGIVSVNGQVTDKWAVMEAPLHTSVPGGLLVSSCLLNLPKHPFQKVPIVLKNETEHDITIPGKSVIADLHAIGKVLSCRSAQKEVESERLSNTKENPTKELSFEFGDSPLPEEWRERISNKLRDMPEVFAFHDFDVGRTDKVKHNIKLHDETPFKHRARPIHPDDFEAVRRHLEELLEAGIIRESESSFSSPIVVVKKKNGDVRLCIDYRKLNTQTIKDAYALPNLEETFSALRGSKWFSVLDLKSGYYQIEVEERDKPKTAFVCPMGFWEFNRMPQGITNAPSTFQRLMEKCMGDINLTEVLVFLDDLIVFSDTLEEHETRLMHVLNRLSEYGLKLSVEKCKFFQTSVRYLGHIVSQNGVETDPQKIETIKTWPSPKTLKELRSFLGFSGYYRRFIKNYAKIARPLNDLTVGYPPLRKSCKGKTKNESYLSPKVPFGGRWKESCQQAFDMLIEKLTSAPVLGFADPKLPYVLHTDASTTGLGAALYQEQGGELRAIAFASRGLSKSEARYPAHKLEFLALKWAVTEKFSDYLYGSNFKVVTDSNPLTYVLTSAKLDATSYRWLSALSTFSFTLQYRPGKSNLDADGLSRRPHGALTNDLVSQKEQERINQFTLHHLPENAESILVPTDVVQAISDKHLVRLAEDECIPLIESLAVSAEAVPASYECDDGLSVVPCITEQELKDKQRADPAIQAIILQIETGQPSLPVLRREIPELPFLLRELKKLELRDGILYRKRVIGDNTSYQLVLPTDLRQMVLEQLHDNMGHLGIERTIDLVRARFYWPKMAIDVEVKIKTCSRCVCRKTPPQRTAPLVNIQVSRPLELVCMDYLSLEPDRSNVKDILVITDHFTKYAVAIPTPNQKARTVAKCLWENFFVHYGVPEKLHSDQGPDFESKTIKELCEIAGIRKVRTTPYHPRGNPVERFNRTLLGMLGTLDNKDKTHWKDFVKPIVHAYNCTKHDTTGFTPYELMFGRQPRLPIDLAFKIPVNNSNKKSHSQYVQTLKTNLQESYDLARKNAAKVAERNKTRYDKRVTESPIDLGDRVLVRNVRLRGKHKLADKWDSVVYIVVNRAGELPVYTVKPEGRDGPLRTLHRDLLLPCGFLSPGVIEKQTTHKPRGEQTVRRKVSEVEQDSPEQCQDHDEDDDDYLLQLSEPIVKTTPFSLVKEFEVVTTTREASHRCAGNPTSPDSVSASGNVIEGTYEGNLPKPGYLPEVQSPAGSDIVGSDDVSERDVLEQRDQQSLNSPDVPVRKARVDPVDCTVSDEETESEESDTESRLRQSKRVRQKPKRLTYPDLGNPMITIMQSLLQGLNTAFVDTLVEQAKSAKVHKITKK